MIAYVATCNSNSILVIDLFAHVYISFLKAVFSLLSVASFAVMAGYLSDPSMHCMITSLSGCAKNVKQCRTVLIFSSSLGNSTLWGYCIMTNNNYYYSRLWLYSKTSDNGPSDIWTISPNHIPNWFYHRTNILSTSKIRTTSKLWIADR